MFPSLLFLYSFVSVFVFLISHSNWFNICCPHSSPSLPSQLSPCFSTTAPLHVILFASLNCLLPRITHYPLFYVLPLPVPALASSQSHTELSVFTLTLQFSSIAATPILVLTLRNGIYTSLISLSSPTSTFLILCVTLGLYNFPPFSAFPTLNLMSTHFFQSPSDLPHCYSLRSP